MIVSHETRALFVHIQKTGGVSIEQTLLERLPGAEKLSGLPGRRHATLATAVAQRPEVAAYWTFGFVRDPWARMWSWWAMIQQRAETARTDAAMALRLSRNAFWSGVLEQVADFEEFVLRGPDLFPRLAMPQVDYLRAGTKQADLVGRTESLDADFRAVCDHLGIAPPTAVPRHNVGPGLDHRAQYTEEMRERVGEIFAPDIERFGYTF